MTERIYKSTSK